MILTKGFWGYNDFMNNLEDIPTNDFKTFLAYCKRYDCENCIMFTKNLGIYDPKNCGMQKPSRTFEKVVRLKRRGRLEKLLKS